MQGDEFQFIKSITPQQVNQSSLIKGIGDDAALFRFNAEWETVVCVDTMVEDVHFSLKTMPAYHIGYKALAVNISDLAAMGAIPAYYLVSIAIPSKWADAELYKIYEGMSDLAANFKMDLIGGDTVSTSDRLVVTVTVIGKVEKGCHLFRSHAKAGDVVFITGHVGGSAAGLELLLEHGWKHDFTVEEKRLIEAHQLPVPQVQAGRLLAEHGGKASLNDISDGIASEVNELAEASDVAIELDFEKIPLSEDLKSYSATKQFKWGLYGGEDFQLVGTVERSRWDLIEQRFKEAGIKATIVGEVNKGPAQVLLKHNKQMIVLEKKGYNHFKRQNQVNDR